MKYMLDYDGIQTFCDAMQSMLSRHWMLLLYHKAPGQSAAVHSRPQLPAQLGISTITSWQQQQATAIAVPIRSGHWFLPVSDNTSIVIHERAIQCTWTHADASETTAICVSLATSPTQIANAAWSYPNEKQNMLSIARQCRVFPTTQWIAIHTRDSANTSPRIASISTAQPVTDITIVTTQHQSMVVTMPQQSWHIDMPDSTMAGDQYHVTWQWANERLLLLPTPNAAS